VPGWTHETVVMETYLHTQVRDVSYREVCDFEGPGRGEMAFRGTAARGVVLIGTKSARCKNVPMTTGGEEAARPSAPDSTGSRPALRLGSMVALAMAGVTVVTFALALTALPNDVPHPFTSDVIADQWPGDYL